MNRSINHFSSQHFPKEGIFVLEHSSFKLHYYILTRSHQVSLHTSTQ